jgi:large subunit ribosomal protein L17
MLANMTCSLIISGTIRTTVTKAKELRRYAEKMVTIAKKGTLHHIRLAVSRLHDKDAVRLLFNDVAPRFRDRNGGYTRIVRLGRRIGDAAEMCMIQWVEEGSSVAPPEKTEKDISAVAADESPKNEG